MSDTVRWGILGAARFARNHMGPAIQMARGGRLDALGTTSPEKAAGFLDWAPQMRVVEGYQAVLDDPTIDAVYIPLANSAHVEWSLKALEAGKHVLCEKPMAMSAGEFDPLIALRDKTGLLAAEAYMIVHHPQFRLAREIVQSGRLGKTELIDAFFTYDNSGDPGNIRNAAETGGGSLPDIGVYTMGAARFLSGEEPEDIIEARIEWENGVDVWAEVAARFPSFRFRSVTSMRLPRAQHLTVYGSKATMRMPAPFNAGVFGEACVELLSEDHTSELIRFPVVNQYELQVEAFNAAVTEGAEYACPLEFSRGTQDMLDRIFAAAH